MFELGHSPTMTLSMEQNATVKSAAMTKTDVTVSKLVSGAEPMNKIF